jgi:carboxyl-terminal processing protease
MGKQSKLNFLCVSFLSIITLFTIATYAAGTETSDDLAVESFVKITGEIEHLLQANIYDPKALLNPAYQDIQNKIRDLSTQVNSESEFIDGFNQLWKNGPFSHVNLVKSSQNAVQMALYFDYMNVGGKGVELTFKQGTAVLTVNTMMGQDTIKQIEHAYQQIAEQKSTNLIIDLRNNQGGAFAVVPLVGHILSEGLDSGIFLSHSYAQSQNTLPSVADISKISPWQGWSITSFWQDAEVNPITRIRFESLAPNYSGMVYVLVSHKTASAAEMAAEAMQASGRAMLVGEQTAGVMLSQKPYDLSNGWILFLPFADYIARHSGRIEGKGLQPDVAIQAEQALDCAMTLIDNSAIEMNRSQFCGYD